MSEQTPTVDQLIAKVPSEQRRRDAADLISMMTEVTGYEPVVWNPTTIGFGQYHYRYQTGQEGEFFTIGLSPRKDRITLYVMSGLKGFDDILERLGPHQAGKSTVHLKRLEDNDREALIDLIAECVNHIEAVEESLGAIPRMDDIPPRQPKS